MKQKQLDESVGLIWKKKIVFPIVTLMALFLLIELCFREFFAFYVGPSVLLYGTPLARKV